MILKRWNDIKGLFFIDTIYKFFVYRDFLDAISPKILAKNIRKTREKQKNAISTISKKNSINVVFFLQTPSIWKYETLYRYFEKSELFNPTVVIAPYNVHLGYDKKECLDVMHKTEEYVQSQGYNFICSYDFEKKRWKNVKKILSPDIVFFTKPYKDTLPKYHIYNFKECLTLYVPYGFLCIDNYRQSYNLAFHNYLWKFLVETDFQKEFAEKYSLSKGDNVLVAGALGVEKLMDPKYQPKDVWKPQTKPKKRIIWAPHHTVDYLFNFSNFLAYCDLMPKLAEKYKDSVQFAFKPHPVLKFKLINLWGKEKTEAYYQQWAEMENTQIEEGYYMDLFLTSDAMIHDCASFTAEYLYTNKPVLFMVRDSQVLSHWNPFGRNCFDIHYHAENMDEIEQFIDRVVILGDDTMKRDRETFYHEYLYPKDGVMPSQKIINYLLDTLTKSHK